LTVTWKCK